LYAQGFRGEELLTFELELPNPSTIYKRQQVDLLNEKMNLATNMLESNLFSHKYIYEKLFDMTEDEWTNEQEMVVQWLREKFRFEQITSEGNDPKITGKSYGTPHDLLALQVASRDEGDMGKQLYPDGENDKRHENPGRPERYGTFGTDDDKAFGRDPDGRKSYEKTAIGTLVSNVTKAFQKNDSVKKSIISENDDADTIKMMDESELLTDESMDNLFNE
jgi:hypothetical protein